MTPKVTNFGQYLRAARLGFHWHEGLGCFMRVCGEGPPWKVQLCPMGQVTNQRAPGNRHRVWWDDPSEDPVDVSPVLQRIKHVKRPMELTLDDEGRLVA